TFGIKAQKKYSDIEWNQGTKRVAKLKKKVTFSSFGEFKGRAEVFQNGTLRLIHTIAADAGEYSFEMFNEGRCILKNKIQLHLLDLAQTQLPKDSNYSTGRKKQANLQYIDILY
uniref:Immunoglobulin V-set domain-containing protein n=1 Tax=Callorhinchus milii TaxID=7868 RepID=A0A4W3HSJ4_CALMI